MGVTIPNPTESRYLEGSTRAMFTAPPRAGEQEAVVLTCRDSTVTFSLCNRLLSGYGCADLLNTNEIPGRVVVQASSICFSCGLQVEVTGSPDELRLVRAVLPNLYSALREPDARASVRAVYRRLLDELDT